MKSNYAQYIFSEDLDYSNTPNTSIWGDGDADTLVVLRKFIAEKRLHGNWLHVAAGDGRYNNLLLSAADSVLATDIDIGALQKLQKITPPELFSKLTILEQNITSQFPFSDGSYDGVFNTGTLHFFPESILTSMFKEVCRILKTRGLFLFDFATDVKRLKNDGSFVGRTDVEYTQSEAKTMLSSLLKRVGFHAQFTACTVPPEEVTSADGTYMFSCNYWLIIAEKK